MSESKRLTGEKLAIMQRCARSNGPWYSDDLASDVLADINAFTAENEAGALTLADVQLYLDRQPKA